MKAVALSAGFGTRLGDLTRDVPKPMLPVAGRPLLEHLIAHLVRHGFDEIAVNLHFRADAVRAHFGDGAQLGVRITYSYESELLGTAGTLTSLREFFGDDAFLVHYGDVLTDHDLGALRSAHEDRGALCTVLLHERPGSNSVVVLDEDGRIARFIERPGPEDPVRRLSSWTNSGICVCDPRVLDLVPPAPCDLARDVLPEMAGRDDFYGVPLDGVRVAVDSPQRYLQAEAVAERMATSSGA